jgi:hypothetical protein
VPLLARAEQTAVAKEIREELSTEYGIAVKKIDTGGNRAER